MTTPIIAANWKMHKTLTEGIALASSIQQALAQKKGPKVILFPTFLHLPALATQLRNATNLHLGAQNCHHENQGAYTGEISPMQLRDLGVKYVLVGHSERRVHNKEGNTLLNAKIKQAIQHNLHPILCCGEPHAVRTAGTHVAYVCHQLTAALNALSTTAYAQLIIAYEPLWAIGTGETATPKQAQDMHKALRVHISHLAGNGAQTVPILYGGSVKPENTPQLAACPDIDGVLVGGASLQGDAFLSIVDAFKRPPLGVSG